MYSWYAVRGNTYWLLSKTNKAELTETLLRYLLEVKKRKQILEERVNKEMAPARTTTCRYDFRLDLKAMSSKAPYLVNKHRPNFSKNSYNFMVHASDKTRHTVGRTSGPDFPTKGWYSKTSARTMYVSIPNEIQEILPKSAFSLGVPPLSFRIKSSSKFVWRRCAILITAYDAGRLVITVVNTVSVIYTYHIYIYYCIIYIDHAFLVKWKCDCFCS